MATLEHAGTQSGALCRKYWHKKGAQCVKKGIFEARSLVWMVMACPFGKEAAQPASPADGTHPCHAGSPVVGAASAAGATRRQNAAA